MGHNALPVPRIIAPNALVIGISKTPTVMIMVTPKVNAAAYTPFNLKIVKLSRNRSIGRKAMMPLAISFPSGLYY